MAVTFNKDFFEFLEKADLHDREDLSFAIEKSVRTKAKVVSMDEREKGVRAVLNYGHTFAHVIENMTSYSRFLHGEAVAIGMIMANALAVKLNLLSNADNERVKDILKRYNLPVYFEIENKERFYEGFFHDKKTRNGSLKFILPKGIGDYEIVKDLDKELIFEVLSGFSS